MARELFEHAPPTVDHGLRAGSRDDAVFVKELAKKLGYQHRTLVWSGPKPTSGVQAIAG